MKRAHPQSVRHSQGEFGMALVIVLALLVLVTIATMAFFTRATANRTIESSRTNQILAAQLAGTAADYILGSFLQEVRENAEVSDQDGMYWYQVTDPAGVLPARRLASAIGEESRTTTFPNLVRQSAPGADPNASTHNSGTPSANGRLIPPEGWNESALNFGEGFASDEQTPNWVYIHRDGSTASEPSTDAIGRFAYNAYDVSGLLDANIAGHPTLPVTDLVAIKSTLAGADLTALPGVTEEALALLAEFRFPDAASGEAYREAVIASTREGFLSPQLEVGGSQVGRNLFSSRSDLIRYVNLQNPTLVEALPYLTHFSISSNAPGVRVDGNNDQSLDDEPVRRPATVLLTRYRDDGTAVTKEVRAGAPLLDRRFSLAKLAWLTPEGPASGITGEAIQASFGLAWNPTERRWDYVGHTGGTVRDELATLEQVASQSRDPNFFELLYAGIGRDSMDLGLGRYWGQPGADDATTWGADSAISSYTGASGFQIDESPQFQVFSIGANIIDQADEDNFPTTLRFAGEDFYGKEDLPYISGLFPKLYYREAGTATQFGDPPVSIFLIPQLWNPHRESLPTRSPEQIQIVISGDVRWRVSLQVPAPTGTTANQLRRRTSVVTPDIATSVFADLQFPLAANLFRATPDIIAPELASGGSMQGGIAPPGLVAGTDFTSATGASLGEYTDPWPDDFRRDYQYPNTTFPLDRSTVPILPAPPYPGGQNPGGQVRSPGVALELTNLRVELNFWDGTSWRTYQRFPLGTGLRTAPLGTGQGGFVVGNLYENFQSDPGRLILRAIDPRTTRFGLAASGNNIAPDIASPTFPTSYPTSTWMETDRTELLAATGFNYEVPQSYDPSAFVGGGWGFRPPMPRFWMNDDPNFFYEDRDGVRRKADGYLARRSANPMFNSATGAANATTSSDRTRPMILQRPFRSVAELGYAFRDQPWKTLDFFSAESADRALLDLFAVEETERELLAGKIHPLAASPEVLQAIVRKTPYDEIFALNPSAPNASISDLEAEDIANRFFVGPMDQLDRSGFPQLVAENLLAEPGTLSKPSREAALRALNDLSDFHTWRIFVDLVVQTGRFPGAATTAEQFVAEGSERAWLSFAIDRKTGRVLARETEFPTQ